jgi:hypothetical protein
MKFFLFCRTLSNKLPSKKFKDFGEYFLNYISKTWVNGKSYPRNSWNMFQHKGPNTNNYQEGYNLKIGSKKEISRHPNPFLLIDVFRSELRAADVNALAAKLGTSNKRDASKKVWTKRKHRQKLMDNLEHHAIGEHNLCIKLIFY